MEVNGRVYPMWGQFVEKEKEFIGGILDDSGDAMDKKLEIAPAQTKITGITLKPNGETSAFFKVEGENFSCGFDVARGGIIAGEEGWLTFSGYGGHIWRIKKP